MPKIKAKESQQPLLPYLCLAFGIGLFAMIVYGGTNYDLNRFGENFAESLCSKLQPHHTTKDQSTTNDAATPSHEDDTNDAVIQSNKRPPSRLSYLGKQGKNYNAKMAMEKRSKHLLKTCQKFNDVMTPLRELRNTKPERQEWFYFENGDSHQVSFCGIPGVAKRRLQNLSRINGNGKSNG